MNNQPHFCRLCGTPLTPDEAWCPRCNLRYAESTSPDPLAATLPAVPQPSFVGHGQHPTVAAPTYPQAFPPPPLGMPPGGTPVGEPSFIPPAPPVRPPTGLPHNRQRTVALVWLGVTGFFLLIAGVPFVIDMDMMNGGFALVFIMGFLVIVGLVTSLVFFGRASSFDRMFSAQSLLAHWTYTPGEWQRYADAEFEIQKTEKVPLLVLVAVISLVVGGVFVVADPKAGAVVAGVLLGVLALLTLLVVVVPRVRYAKNRNTLGEAYIARNGVYLNGAYHNWDMLGAHLENVELLDGSPLLLAFIYSFPTRAGRQEETVRMPVPAGQEAAAAWLAQVMRSPNA